MGYVRPPICGAGTMHISYDNAAAMEPPLMEVMRDPIVRSLMKHDAVRDEDIALLADHVAGLED